jgi:hypothetical protein
MKAPNPSKSFCDPRWPPHWRTDHKEIVAELEASGWRVFKSYWKPGRGWDYEPHKEKHDLVLGPTHRFRSITPGAWRALNEVVMGRPAPRRAPLDGGWGLLLEHFRRAAKSAVKRDMSAETRRGYRAKQ